MISTQLRSFSFGATLLFAVLLVVPQIAYGDTLTGWFVMDHIAGTRKGMFVVPPTGETFQNPANCSPPNNYYLALDDYAEFYQQSAAIMAAYLGKYEVQLYIDNSACADGYPKINAVHVRDPQ